MSKHYSLKKLTFIYTVGSFTSKAINFGLFFVYTFYLTKEEVGRFDIILTTITLLCPIITLQIYDAVLRWLINTQDLKVIQKTITASLLILLINLLIFTTAFWGTASFTTIPFGKWIYCLMVFQSFYLLIPQIARGLNQNLTYALGGVVYSLLFTIATVLFLIVLNWRVEGLIIANLLAALLTGLFLSAKINLFKYVNFKKMDIIYIKEMIYYSFPLIPNTLSWWAISTSNRYIILFFLGAAFNGMFAIALKLPSVLFMISGIFSMAWNEKAIKSFDEKERDQYYSNVLAKYINLLFGLIILLVAMSKPLLKLAVQPSYYDIWKLLPILYLSVGFQSLSSFLGTGYISSKDTKKAFTTTIYGALVTVLSSLLMIPYLGLMGASMAILAGYIVMFGVRLYHSKNYFTITFPTRNFLELLGLLAFVSLATTLDNLLILVLNTFVAAAVFLIYNKKLIFSMLKKYTQPFSGLKSAPAGPSNH